LDGAVGFSDLKLELTGAIVAISAVELLKAFINVEDFIWHASSRMVGITSRSSSLACYLQ